MGRKIYVFITMLIVTIGCDSFYDELPRDKKLRQTFIKKETEFVTLKDMILSEKLNLDKKGNFNDIEIGLDKTGDFWLTGNYWTLESDSTHKKYTQEEMLQILGLSIDTYQQYIALLNSINASRIMRTGKRENFSILFTMGCSGFLDKGGCKYIVFSSTPINYTVDNTDDALWYSKESDISCLSQLKENWFIQLDWAR